MIRFSLGVRNAVANAVKDIVGDYASVLRIYTGAQPATADTAATGTLLCEIALTSGFITATTGFTELSLAPTGEVGTAVATGTAGYGRWTNAGGTISVDGSVGTAGTDFIISPANITDAETVTVTSLRMSQPAQ